MCSLNTHQFLRAKGACQSIQYLSSPPPPTTKMSRLLSHNTKTKTPTTTSALTESLIVTGATITLAGLAYGAYYYLCRHSSSASSSSSSHGDHERASACRALVPAQLLKKYTIGKLLGEGSYACVFCCTKSNETSTQDNYAIKVIPRKFLLNNHLQEFSAEFLEAELAILRRCTHPNILGLVDSQWTKEALVFVTERAFGGVLFDKIVELGNYNENVAKSIFQQLLEGVRYLHDDARVIHRDLKPENILLMDDGQNDVSNDNDNRPDQAEEEFTIPKGFVKICDFGVSKMWTKTAPAKKTSKKTAFRTKSLRTTTVTGTPGYQAPEMINGGDCDYGTGVDIWSLGIILHAMLCGELPLTLPPTFVSGSSQSNNAWDHVSEMGKRLVTQMLQENPTLRPTAAQALKSEWFNQKNTTSTAGTKERRISMQAQALWSTVRSKLKVASKDKRVGKKKMHVINKW